MNGGSFEFCKKWLTWGAGPRAGHLVLTIEGLDELRFSPQEGRTLKRVPGP